MLLPEDSDMDLHTEDTKIFTQQWQSDVSDASFYIKDICRICLAVDVKMFKIGDYKLRQYYQNVTGILSSMEDRLPKVLCWECTAKLRAANSFKEKALRSYKLLMSKLKADTFLSMRDVQSINRIENKLQSTLTVKCIEGDTADTGQGGGSLWTGPNGRDTEDVTAALGDDLTIVELKQEEDHEELDEDIFEELDEEQELESDETWQETEVDTGSDRDPLDTAPPRRRAPAATTKSRAKPPQPRRARGRKTASTSARRAAPALDGAVFEVVEVSLERALADAARRAERAAYRAAPHRCDLCYKVFPSPAAQQEHALRHSDAMGAFECAVCRCRWKTRTAMRKHFTESHTRDHSCKMCPFTTRNRGVAKRHERSHKGAKFQCPECPKEFVAQTSYLNHLRLKHVCRIPCELCGFTFHTHRGVNSHKFKMHKRDKNTELAGPYCPACDVRFVSDDAHDRHLQLSAAHRKDIDIKPYSRRRIRNDYHMADKRGVLTARGARPERGPGPVRCEQCGAECEGFRAYAQHFRRQHPGCNRTQYSGAEPAMCEHCGKIFQNSCLMRAHARVHSEGAGGANAARGPGRPRGRRGGVAAFACPLCPKRFTEKTNRARHIATIHRGAERRHRCAVCDKRFFERGALQSHVDHVHLKKPWPKRVRAHRPRPAPHEELGAPDKAVGAEV